MVKGFCRPIGVYRIKGGRKVHTFFKGCRFESFRVNRLSRPHPIGTGHSGKIESDYSVGLSATPARKHLASA